MNEYIKEPIEDYFQRTRDISFQDTDLGKILEYLPRCYASGPWICGGALRRTLNRDPKDKIYLGDIDYFCFCEEQARFLEKQIMDLKFLQEEEKGVNFKFCIQKSKWALTFSIEIINLSLDHFLLGNPSSFRLRDRVKMQLQIIIRNYQQTVQETLDTFHYSICQFGYDGTNLIYSPIGLWDLRNKILTPNLPVEGNAWQLYEGMMKFDRDSFIIDPTIREEILERIDNEDRYGEYELSIKDDPPSWEDEYTSFQNTESCSLVHDISF